MKLPPKLVEKVKKGEVVLLLGSGALYDAKLPNNKKIPLGNDLRDLLSDQFLGGDLKNETLSYVSQLAISETSLFEVQEFIKEYLEDLEPANYHFMLAEFKWRRLYTTNYDLLVESIYNNRDQKPKSLQKLSIVYSDSNIKDSCKLKPNQLEYFKLHGCISRARELDLPFVLTIDDFNNTLENKRKDMLKTLYEMALNYPIVFVGHSNQDSNIRSILQKVRIESPQGQRHYLMKPGARDSEIRAWEEKKITILNMGFEDFLKYLDESISPNERMLSLMLNKNDHPIQRRFIVNDRPSHSLTNLLETDCQFIHEDIPIGSCKPDEFYKGKVIGWSGVHLEYAIERNLQEKFIRESFKKPEAERDKNLEFIVITGASGTGKTVFLRQLAWSSLKKTTSIALWVKHAGEPNIDSIAELCEKTNERVYLYWDDLELNKKYIYNFIKLAKVRKLKITIVGCERSNLWATQCETLDEFSTELYTLNRMSENEIDRLVIKLELHEVLSPFLKTLNHEDRCNYIKEKSERHLLVALYEITTGKRFEEIIQDEFDRIFPLEAQSIYQTICTLNKYGISVRAGLLSRIHKIPFKEFGNRFLKPLENIIFSINDYSDDLQYVSRHPEIADIVDRYVLETPQFRINEYMEILKHINISYSVDERCFKQLLKAKNMQDVFGNPDNAIKVYEYAVDTMPDNAYLLQQMALYIHRTSHDKLNEVVNLLINAKDLEPYNSSILHSLYLVYKDSITFENSETRKENYMREALSYIGQMVELEGNESSYSASARIDLKLKLLSYDIRNEKDPSKPYIQKQITICQDAINSFKQKFPEDTYSYEFDKKLTGILKDHEGYVTAVKTSYEQGHKTPDRAITVAKIKVDEDDLDGAVAILKDAISNNRNVPKLYFEYAELLRKFKRSEVLTDTLAYNYQRSYSPNDNNYIAHFWFARFAFLSEDKEYVRQSLKTFRELKSVRTASSSKREIRDIDYDISTSNPIDYYGTISKIMYQHGFIDLSNRDMSIYFYKDNMNQDEDWELLQVGDRLKFNIGYNYLGATAINIQII